MHAIHKLKSLKDEGHCDDINKLLKDEVQVARGYDIAWAWGCFSSHPNAPTEKSEMMVRMHAQTSWMMVWMMVWMHAQTSV